jgi:hypothetical protein
LHRSFAPLRLYDFNKYPGSILQILLILSRK